MQRKDNKDKSIHGYSKKSLLKPKKALDIDERLLSMTAMLKMSKNNKPQQDKTTTVNDQNILGDISQLPPIRPKDKNVQLLPYSSQPSSARSSFHYDSDSDAPIFIKPSPISFFGFVPIDDELTQSVILINNHNQSIQVSTEIPENEIFKLIDDTSVMIMGNQSHEVKVRFRPNGKNQYRGVLKIKLLGKLYNHVLFGIGGCAHIDLPQTIKLKYIPSLMQYVMCPQNLETFALSMRNIGNRSAFVQMMAVNRDGHEIDGVSFSKKHFVVRENNASEEINVTVREHVLNNHRMNHGLSGISNNSANIARYSSASSCPTNYGHLFDIKIFWSTERARRRAKQ